MDPILKKLRSADPRVRLQGLDALQEQRGSMSREQAHRLLWAAGGDLPEVDEDDVPVAEAILVAARPWVDPDDVELLRSLYPRLQAGARSVTLTLLAAIGTEDAARAWSECLERHGAGSHLGSQQCRPWSDALRHGDLFFPDLLEAGLPTPHLEEILLMAGHFLEGGAFPDAAQDALKAALLELWSEIEDELDAAIQGPPGARSDRARALRRRAGLLLDLMRFLDDDESAQALQRAMTSADPRLRLFAIRGTLHRGRKVTAQDVLPVAEAPETRATLYAFLKVERKLSLVPRALRTQQAMAEADLSSWLASSAELGHPPDAVEARARVTIEDATEGRVDWHILRFRSTAARWEDRGWMLGISGPWIRKDGPGGHPGGDTFSGYAPWVERSEDEHAAALRDVTGEWSGRRG